MWTWFFRVDGAHVVKISDFGMSVYIRDGHSYKMPDMSQPLPVKWTAIEAMTEGIFSFKSDVVR